jgi:excisionase family DNA binding protein
MVAQAARLIRGPERTMSTNQNHEVGPVQTGPHALPDYETKMQVARRLGVSTRTVDNLMRQRRLPFVKLSSKIVRFPRVEVDDYIRRNLTVRARGQESGVAA